MPTSVLERDAIKSDMNFLCGREGTVDQLMATSLVKNELFCNAYCDASYLSD